MRLAAAGALVPSASQVGGSVVVRESGSKWPIAVSVSAEDRPRLFHTQLASWIPVRLTLLGISDSMMGVDSFVGSFGSILVAVAFCAVCLLATFTYFALAF